MKIKYQGKILSNDNLKEFFKSSILYHIHAKNLNNKWHNKDLLILFMLFILSFGFTAMVGVFSQIEFQGLLSVFAFCLILSTPITMVLFNFITFTYKHIIKRKHKKMFKLFYIPFFDFSLVKEMSLFSEKHNFNEIIKALESYDFQSPHLSSLISEVFSFSQDDLVVLSKSEVLDLYEKIQHNKKASKTLAKAILEKKPIRKIDEKLLLDLKEHNFNDNNCKLKDSDPLNIILKDVNEKENLWSKPSTDEQENSVLLKRVKLLRDMI